MPKINFNIPFVDEKGEPNLRLKVDPKKIKIGDDGQPKPEIIVDENGFAVQEVIHVKDILSRMLNMNFPGDEKISFSERAKRGKLARKVETSSSVHYTDEEIQIIAELTAKSGSTTLLAQLDDLFGKPE